jgi:transcriptional regulator with XRE-family HTH domain
MSRRTAGPQADTLALHHKLEHLREYARRQGTDITLRAISDATGSSTSSVHEILSGRSRSPELRTVAAIVAYLGAELAYLDCQTEAECQAYLRQRTRSEVISLVEQVRLRGDKTEVRATEELLRRMLLVLIDPAGPPGSGPPGPPPDEGQSSSTPE